MSVECPNCGHRTHEPKYTLRWQFGFGKNDWCAWRDDSLLGVIYQMVYHRRRMRRGGVL